MCKRIVYVLWKQTHIGRRLAEPSSGNFVGKCFMALLSFRPFCLLTCEPSTEEKFACLSASECTTEISNLIKQIWKRIFYSSLYIYTKRWKTWNFPPHANLPRSQFSHLISKQTFFFSWKFTRFRAREMSEHISRYTSERQFSQTCKTLRRVGCSEMMVGVWDGKIKNYHHSSETLCFLVSEEYFTCDVCAFTLVFVLTEPRWCCQIRWWLFMWILCCCSFILLFSFPYNSYFCGSSRKNVIKLKLVLHERLHFERPKN